MNKEIWRKLGYAFLSLSAFALPWQTKLIVRPSVSDYWEISIYAASLFIFLAVLFFIPAGFLREGIRNIPRFGKRIGIVLAIAGTVSATFSSDPILSFYLLALLILSLAFFVIVSTLTPAWKKRLAIFVLISLLAQAFLGIYQFVTQLSFASTILGIAYHSAADLGTAVIETVDGRWLRAYGASGHPNAFGGLMVIGAIGSLFFFTQARLLAERIPFAFFFLIFLAATIVSFSRAALLALGIGLLIFFLEQRQVLKSSLRATAVLAIASVCFAGSIICLYQPLFIARAQTANRLEVISIEDRAEFNRRGIDNFLRRPFFGSGFGASTQADRGRMPEAPAWRFQPAHNYWLLAAAEGGIFFVIALALIWALAFQKSRQRRLVALIGTLFILTLFDHWLFSLPLASAWLFFLFALM